MVMIIEGGFGTPQKKEKTTKEKLLEIMFVINCSLFQSKKKKEKLLDILKENPSLMKYVFNKKLQKELVYEIPECLGYMDNTIRNNKDFIFDLINRMNPKTINVNHLGLSLKKDFSFKKELVNNNIIYFYAFLKDESITSDRELCFSVLKYEKQSKHFLSLQHMSKEIKDDDEIMSFAIEMHPDYISKASNRIKENPNNILKVIDDVDVLSFLTMKTCEQFYSWYFNEVPVGNASEIIEKVAKISNVKDKIKVMFNEKELSDMLDAKKTKRLKI